MIFAIFVVINHTDIFIKENTRINKSFVSYMGWIGVWFFFIVSGFFMVQSVSKRYINNIDDAGEKSLEFVVNKFKGIFIPYVIAEFILVIPVYIIIKKQNAFIVILKTIPDLIAINASGVKIRYNGPTWYISAMLIVMLFLCYILITKRDFFLYVFPRCVQY